MMYQGVIYQTYGDGSLRKNLKTMKVNRRKRKILKRIIKEIISNGFRVLCMWRNPDSEATTIKVAAQSFPPEARSQ